MSTENLKNIVLENFSGQKFTDNGWKALQPELNDDGTYDIPFSVFSTISQIGENKDPRFHYIKNGFKIILLNCEYDSNEWKWEPPYDYKVIAGEDSCVAISFYDETGTVVSEEEYADDCYYGLMPVADNKTLGRKITSMLMDNTDRVTTLAIFTEMLKDYGAPDSSI
ncbi:MAG: hypothetical protein J6N72_10615 [Psychrobacter sp.]|nr:hypothetical protein [Psychrobacter sp.]